MAQSTFHVETDISLKPSFKYKTMKVLNISVY